MVLHCDMDAPQRRCGLFSAPSKHALCLGRLQPDVIRCNLEMFAPTPSSRRWGDDPEVDMKLSMAIRRGSSHEEAQQQRRPGVPLPPLPVPSYVLGTAWVGSDARPPTSLTVPLVLAELSDLHPAAATSRNVLPCPSFSILSHMLVPVLMLAAPLKGGRDPRRLPSHP